MLDIVSGMATTTYTPTLNHLISEAAHSHIPANARTARAITRYLDKWFDKSLDIADVLSKIDLVTVVISDGIRYGTNNLNALRAQMADCANRLDSLIEIRNQHIHTIDTLMRILGIQVEAEFLIDEYVAVMKALDPNRTVFFPL